MCIKTNIEIFLVIERVPPQCKRNVSFQRKFPLVCVPTAH